MNDKKDFEAALKGKKVPLLVLDQKWHRLLPFMVRLMKYQPRKRTG